MPYLIRYGASAQVAIAAMTAREDDDGESEP